MYLTFHDKLFDEYMEMEEDHQKFLQRLVFLEYLEHVEQDRFHGIAQLTVQNSLLFDLIQYEEDENYEACQCIKDILKRFDTDFEHTE